MSDEIDSPKPAPEKLDGECPLIIGANKKAEIVAPLPIKVLLTGPTGSGKSHLARYIHAKSGRNFSIIKDVWSQLTDKSLKAMLAWAHGVKYGGSGGVEEDSAIKAFGMCLNPNKSAGQDEKQATNIRPMASKLLEVNLAALSKDTIDAELFGYVYGAFTDARRIGYPGAIISANGGTLFIDEIAECPLPVQAKLLTVIQPREDELSKKMKCPCYVTPLGQNEAVTVDVRLIFATNKNLYEEVRNRRFREDLYYRINGSVIELPSFAKIKECPNGHGRDVIKRYIEEVLAKENKRIFGQETSKYRNLYEGVIEELLDYDFPGNYRELQNILSNALVEAEVRNRIFSSSDNDNLIMSEDIKLSKEENEGLDEVIANMCHLRDNHKGVLECVTEWIDASWIDLNDVRSLSTIKIKLDVRQEGRGKGRRKSYALPPVCDAEAIRSLCYLIKLLKDHNGDKKWTKTRFAERVVGRSGQALDTRIGKFEVEIDDEAAELTFDVLKKAICG